MSFSLRRTSELSFTAASGDAIDFRIEVFERDELSASGRRFRVRVWRYELVRLRLPFRDAESANAAHSTVLVLCDQFDGFEHDGESPDDAASACIAMMKRQFGIEAE